MNFTDTNSFIEMAKNIEYKVNNHEITKYLFILVHWIDRIPDNYEDLQRQGSPDTCLSYWDCPLEWSVDPFYSCTVYCQLPDNIEWQNGGQIEDELHRFLSQKFDLVYFDCSKMKSDNFCIAEYGMFLISRDQPTQISDTSEQAAMTVRYLQSSPFPRYGPASPLQVTFSLPNIAGKVLLKSFQTFYEQVTCPKLRRF